MPSTKNKVDRLHDRMPRVYNTRNNPNWRALIEAIGSSDDKTMQMIEDIRKQFFVKTANRPYLDRLASKYGVQRPRTVGMDDSAFRKFIPVMSYQPKQVKIILDKLLDLFYFKDATTSFLHSSAYENFSLQDGWTLEYEVDGYKSELINFRTTDFTDINNATADEVVAAINRQATSSYAIKFDDSITKLVHVRIFTNTIGAKGSIAITGGLSNVAFKFDGFNFNAGNSNNTEWAINKVGSVITMYYTGIGGSPNIDNVEVGDIVLLDIPNLIGSFTIESIDVGKQSISFTSLFGEGGDGSTPYCHQALGGTQAVCELNGGLWLQNARLYQQINENQAKFLKRKVMHVYNQERRAMAWEVRQGVIDIEMPASPPIVRRSRKGGAYINGVISTMVNRLSDTSLEVQDGSKFPEDGGQLLIEQLEQIQMYIPQEATINNLDYNTRLISDQGYYKYTSRVGNTLLGVTPNLPAAASLNQFNLISANRNSNMLTVITTTPHNYQVGDYAIIDGTTLLTGSVSPNGAWKILQVVNTTQFIAQSDGDTMTSSGGTVKVEKPGLKNNGSKIILRSSVMAEPNSYGAYLWDKDAPYVLSSSTGKIDQTIKAGTIVRNISLVSGHNIPNQEGSVVFDFGTSKEEGPVRYFFTPTTNTISIDPAYIFQYNHDINSSITVINRRGGIEFSGYGDEYAAYITDPATAREVLQELLAEVKSVGIFLNFIIRYPEQVYATIDVYRSGIDPG